MADPNEMAQLIANRVRGLRLMKGWTRRTLANRSGISEASLKRFETTGKSSLDLVLRVAHALSRLDDFNELLRRPAAGSMKDLESQIVFQSKERKRGRI